MQERTLRQEAMQVTQHPPFTTSQQYIYCLIMQSHELDTTKPTNKFHRVIFLEKLCVSKGMAIISNSCWRGGGHGKFHLQHLSVVGSPCNYKQEQCEICL